MYKQVVFDGCLHAQKNWCWSMQAIGTEEATAQGLVAQPLMGLECLLSQDHPQDKVPSEKEIRFGHRHTEYLPFVHGAILLHDMRAADNVIPSEAIGRLMRAHQSKCMQHPPSLHGRQHHRARGFEHPSGELASYFDGVWVLAGTKPHERLVCLRLDEQHLLSIHYCPGHNEKPQYMKFLSLLERRWYSHKAGGCIG